MNRVKYNFIPKLSKKARVNDLQGIDINPILKRSVTISHGPTKKINMDVTSVVAALLHDTIEDTYATYETIKGEFGEEVADLVDGVTKISVFENQAISNSKAENFRKLILATSKDIRVLLVKLADRLHNMRTLKGIDKEEKRKRIAKETMEIYAPLADRMGMNRIRDELEDLSFEVLNPEARKLIKDRLNQIKDSN